jgi:hypothetical protein
MPSMEAPNWWADVQQEREDLAGPGRRPAEDWLGEEIDFAPRRRIRRRGDHSGESPTGRDAASPAGADHPMHGVFIPTDDVPSHRPGTVAPVPSSMTIELETGRVIDEGPEPVEDSDVVHELRHLRAADDPFATPPPPVGARRTVQIKGRPGESRAHSTARRHRRRTASDRIGPRPDRIALWAVVLGAILILLAAVSSASQAAVPHRATAAHAAAARSAHVTHVVRHAPARVTRVHP